MSRSGYLSCLLNECEAEILNKQKKSAKEILGTNYIVVHRFFRKVLESEYRYKIFRSRRCQVLFNIFAPIILDEMSQEDPNVLNRDKGIFLSDNSLAKYKKEIVKIVVGVRHGEHIEEIKAQKEEVLKVKTGMKQNWIS